MRRRYAIKAICLLSPQRDVLLLIASSVVAAEALTLLNALRKLCNHPALLGQASDRDGGAGTSVAGADLDGGAKFHALRIILEAVK